MASDNTSLNAADGDQLSAAPTAAATVKYEAVVVEVGPMVAELFAAGVLILFGEKAPPELREIAVVHDGRELTGALVPGDIIELGSERHVVTAVGEVANANLAELGHIVIKNTGATETELPGEVYVEDVSITVPTVGARLRLLAGEVTAPFTPQSATDTPGAAESLPSAPAWQQPTQIAIGRQRRSLWAFLSDWLNWRRRGARSA